MCVRVCIHHPYMCMCSFGQTEATCEYTSCAGNSKAVWILVKRSIICSPNTEIHHVRRGFSNSCGDGYIRIGSKTTAPVSERSLVNACITPYRKLPTHVDASCCNRTLFASCRSHRCCFRRIHIAWHTVVLSLFCDFLVVAIVRDYLFIFNRNT